MKEVLIAAGDKALTKFVAEALLGRQINRQNPSLANREWDVSRAHTALETTLLVTRGRRVFDVIVLDHDLPGRDLLGTLAELRKLEASEDVPIFVMSERGRDQLTRRLASERFFVAGFIDKPVTTESLERGLRNLRRRRQVLVVDSNAERAAKCRKALEDAGYEVTVVEHGLEAEEVVERERPDAVVCALSLDDLAGAEVCARIKRRNETHTVPVLLHGDISELARVEIAENANRADDFLREPFDARGLVDRVAPLAGRSATKPSDAPDAPKDKLQPGRVTAPAGEAPPAPPSFPPELEMPDEETDLALPVIPADDTDGAVRFQDPAEAPADDSPPTLNTPPPTVATRIAKRAARRVPCRVRVTVADGDTIYESETLNISDGGIMIATDHPLKIGTPINLQFQLPDTAEMIRARGKVAWLSESNAAGVKFSKINPRHLEVIVDYVNRMARVVYVAP